MEGSKIHLSATELDLVCNAEIILTKNTIIKKTVALFEGIQDTIVEENKNNPAQMFSVPPKVSKGENYLGLPYVVLDYPRLSAGNNLCFIRTMFWWGHFFSSTLQVAGSYKEEALWKLAAAYEELAAQNFYVGIQQDPWQHHFEVTNYQKIATLSKDSFFDLLQQQPHIKIAARWPLSEWDAAANLLVNSWTTLLDLVS
jgi:hypothetical protein